MFIINRESLVLYYILILHNKKSQVYNWKDTQSINFTTL